MQKKSKKTFFEKLGWSLVALATFFGLISVTGTTIDWFSWAFIIFIVFFFTIYWHFIEWLKMKNEEIKEYFIKLKKDVKEIKIAVKKMNKRGYGLVGGLKEAIIAAILLYVLWIIIKSLFLGA